MAQHRQDNAATIAEMLVALMQVRPVGPRLMLDCAKKWDDIDEAVNESSPASDSSAKD